MTRKNFKYPWHQLCKVGDFFVTKSPIDKVARAAALHFALRRPDEIVRCISRPPMNDVFVVLVLANNKKTEKYYQDVEYNGEIQAQQGNRVSEFASDQDEDQDEVEDFEEEVLEQ